MTESTSTAGDDILNATTRVYFGDGIEIHPAGSKHPVRFTGRYRFRQVSYPSRLSERDIHLRMEIMDDRSCMRNGGRASWVNDNELTVVVDTEVIGRRRPE